MIIDNPLFGIPIFIGLTFLFAGKLLFKFPPKKINNFYGYRTKNSMKSIENWHFAQKYSAIEMMKFGGFFILFSLFGFFFETNLLLGVVISLIITTAVCIILYRRVENAIRRKN